MRYIALIVALTIGFFAWSNEPTNQKSVEQKDQQSTQKYSAAKPDTSSLEKAIRESIKEASEKPDSHANEKAEIDRKLTEYTRQLAIYTKELSKYTSDVADFTFALVVATILIAAIGVFQWKHDKSSTKAELRAYVAVGDPILKGNFPNEVHLVVKNNGQTPARGLHAHLNYHWIEPSARLPEDFSFPDKGGLSDERSVFTLGKDQEKPITWSINVEDLAKVQTGQRSLFLYGWVKYTDIFDDSWVTEFCYRYTGFREGEDITHTFKMEERYNDAK